MNTTYMSPDFREAMLHAANAHLREKNRQYLYENLTKESKMEVIYVKEPQVATERMDTLYTRDVFQFPNGSADKSYMVTKVKRQDAVCGWVINYISLDTGCHFECTDMGRRVVMMDCELKLWRQK